MYKTPPYHSFPAAHKTPKFILIDKRDLRNSHAGNDGLWVRWTDFKPYFGIEL